MQELTTGNHIVLKHSQMKNNSVKFAILFSAVFGILTLFAGGSVIMDLFGMREKEGNYVLFVVWANFLCGFIYLIASWGFLKRKSWTSFILTLALGILAVTFIGLMIWISKQQPYETKTLFAMSSRLLLTLALWLIARQLRKPVSTREPS